jgi:hypothetical protein
VIFAKNGGDAPNPAALFFEAHWRFKDGRTGSLGTGADWLFVRAKPDDHGGITATNLHWRPAMVENGGGWEEQTAGGIGAALIQATTSERPMIRSALLKSDPLQRTLGRPNREQIVSMRPEELSTLEAMDMSNGPALAERLAEGAKKLVARNWKSPEALVDWLYRASLCRPPAKEELALAKISLGTKLSPEGVEDLLWTLVLLPEFQLVR